MEPITRNLTVVATMVAICASVAVFAADKPNPKNESGFVNLYNGKDLTGWGYRDKDGKILETFDGKKEASDGRYTAKPGVLVVNQFEAGKPRLRNMKASASLMYGYDIKKNIAKTSTIFLISWFLLYAGKRSHLKRLLPLPKLLVRPLSTVTT